MHRGYKPPHPPPAGGTAAKPKAELFCASQGWLVGRLAGWFPEAFPQLPAEAGSSVTQHKNCVQVT